MMNKKYALLLKKLEDKIGSLIDFERCMGLPIGITKKWKSGNVKLKPEDIALIKLVTVFPWFLELADNKFDPIFAEKKLLETAVNLIYKEKNDKIDSELCNRTHNNSSCTPHRHGSASR